VTTYERDLALTSLARLDSAVESHGRSWGEALILRLAKQSSPAGTGLAALLGLSAPAPVFHALLAARHPSLPADLAIRAVLDSAGAPKPQTQVLGPALAKLYRDVGPHSLDVSLVARTAAHAGAVFRAEHAGENRGGAAAIASAAALVAVGAVWLPWVTVARDSPGLRAAAVQLERSGDDAHWVAAWCDALARAAASAERAVRAAARDHERTVREVGATHRVGATDAAVLSHFAGALTAGVADVVGATGLSQPTVGTSLDRLTDSGALIELTGRRRDRVWMSRLHREIAESP